MSAPAFPCEARGLSLPECTATHPSRDIRYIFLQSCRNIPASQHPLDGAGAGFVPHGPAPCRPTAQRCLGSDEDRDFSPPRHLPAFPGATGARGSPEAKKRLPVFRQLCGEAVAGLEELPEARAAPGAAKGWRMAQAAACPARHEA